MAGGEATGEDDGNKPRLGVAVVSFVIWTAITVIGGNLTTGGNKSLSTQ